jgi:hypothetical protein|tara:strand:- start:146 stop:1105 length:960 start_codon:yes stop_codon:yes gene_type:complete
MIENAEQQTPEEEVQIEISDEPEQQAQSEDELTEYSKRVSRRVNKLNQKTREAEERAEAALRLAEQKEQELQQFRNFAVQQQTTTLQAEEDKVKAQESQVDEIYRQAVQSGDADLMSQATTLKNEIAIKKEKINTAKSRQAQQMQQYAQPEQYQQPQQQPQQYQQPAQQAPQQDIKPTEQALGWHERNKWYGDAENEENLQATQFAYFTHFNLINEGYEPDSQDYYEALDSRIGKAYPNLDRGEEAPDAAESESRPAVQRVASATPSGRQQSRGKQSGVRFSNSELERIRGLKPHNMSEDQWLKTVAREKQKIQQRGAR